MAGKLVEIYGVVDEHGGGGGDVCAPYHRNVQFKKWRIAGGEISQQGVEDLLWTVLMLPEFQLIR